MSCTLPPPKKLTPLTAAWPCIAVRASHGATRGIGSGVEPNLDCPEIERPDGRNLECPGVETSWCMKCITDITARDEEP